MLKPEIIGEITHSSVVLKWAHPKNESEAFGHFEIEIKPFGVSKYHLIYRGRSKKYKVRDLKPNCQYSIRICRVGRGIN